MTRDPATRRNMRYCMGERYAISAAYRYHGMTRTGLCDANPGIKHDLGFGGLLAQATCFRHHFAAGDFTSEVGTMAHTDGLQVFRILR
jgi:hypothetical protein